MVIQNRPDEKIFASKAKDNEVQTFPNLERGWGICFEETQGIPPMEWFNQLFNRTDKMVQYYLQRGLPEWSASTEYPASAYVQYAGKSYRALKANANQKPDVEKSQFWVRWALDMTDFISLQNSLTPKKLTANTQNITDATGHTHEINRASVNEAGITQLDSSTDSDAEDKAATPKAVKTIGDRVQKISNVINSGFIQNSKKSNAVDSTSSDTVATSAAVKTAYDKGQEAFNRANDANNNADGRVSKSGDTMTGDLTVPSLFARNVTLENHSSYFRAKSTGHNSSGLDLINSNGIHPQCSIHAVDMGNFSDELRFLTTPTGSNYDTDRRQHVVTIGVNGHIWARPYGWLHDYFLKREDCIRTWYPNHYAGTEVYKIRYLGLMITVMNSQVANRELILPEAYNGHAIVLATDRGAGRHHVSGNCMLTGNKIFVGGNSDTAVSVLVIGCKNF